ncbi:MAG: hypothetical protein HYV08_12415 [Deltaproteobacteria bacterium]|nr:hypothetical protein [Deltaproteobacteria bacterium]MBI3075464.1 hypothetical protein [Deltaproteobacteria bacterium]
MPPPGTLWLRFVLVLGVVGGLLACGVMSHAGHMDEAGCPGMFGVGCPAFSPALLLLVLVVLSGLLVPEAPRLLCCARPPLTGPPRFAFS